MLGNFGDAGTTATDVLETVDDADAAADAAAAIMIELLLLFRTNDRRFTEFTAADVVVVVVDEFPLAAVVLTTEFTVVVRIAAF